jgi:hypothetical protein
MTRHHPINRRAIPVRQGVVPIRSRPHQVQSHRLRCDCGQLAVTVIKVRVGTDPQYTVQLSLCASCLALERSFNARD